MPGYGGSVGEKENTLNVAANLCPGYASVGVMQNGSRTLPDYRPGAW